MQANQAKASRRDVLLLRLEDHKFNDRAQGKIAVPPGHTRTLTALAAATTACPIAPRQDHWRARGMVGEMHDEDSDSCEDIPATGRATLPGQ